MERALGRRSARGMVQRLLELFEPNDLHDEIPDDVQLRGEARRPEMDPTLGIDDVVVRRDGEPKHRLVTIGDSLTHGFQSGAIFNTQWSWPRVVAWEMG